MPRPRPAGSGVPQPALSAASCRAPRRRLARRQVRQPEGERILPGGRRQLVDEALLGEGVLRGVDRAPPAERHPHLGHGGLDLDRAARRRGSRWRPPGRRACRPPGRRAEELLADGGRPHQVVPRHQPAGGVEPGPQLVAPGRAVVVVAHVVLARPDHLHRLAGGLRHLRRLDREVGHGAPAEPAAQEGDVDRHLLRREPQRLGHVRLRPGRRLGRRPELGRAGRARGPCSSSAPWWRGPAAAARRWPRARFAAAASASSQLRPRCAPALLRRRLGQQPLQRRPGRARRSARPRRWPPAPRAPGAPPRSSRPPPRRRSAPPPPGARPAPPAPSGGVEAGHLAAHHRRAGHHGEAQPGDADVDAEAGAPPDLVGRVEPGHPGADEPPVLRVLERRVLAAPPPWRRRPPARRSRASGPSAPWTTNALLGPAGGAVHAPLPGRGRDQHLAGRRAGPAERVEELAHAPRAAGAHLAEPLRRRRRPGPPGRAFQSASSSSATSTAIPVKVPCPISDLARKTVTAPARIDAQPGVGLERGRPRPPRRSRGGGARATAPRRFRPVTLRKSRRLSLRMAVMACLRRRPGWPGGSGCRCRSGRAGRAWPRRCRRRSGAACVASSAAAAMSCPDWQ